jgi:hypothetical protein
MITCSRQRFLNQLEPRRAREEIRKIKPKMMTRKTILKLDWFFSSNGRRAFYLGSFSSSPVCATFILAQFSQVFIVSQ